MRVYYIRGCAARLARCGIVACVQSSVYLSEFLRMSLWASARLHAVVYDCVSLRGILMIPVVSRSVWSRRAAAIGLYIVRSGEVCVVHVIVFLHFLFPTFLYIIIIIIFTSSL